MGRRSPILLAAWLLVASASVASAQVAVPPVPLVVPPSDTGSDCTSGRSHLQLKDTSKNYVKFTGEVEVDCPGDIKLFADNEIELFNDDHKVVATGNVVFVQGANRISAERAEFNSQTRTGTFFNASGIATLGPKADKSMFGTLEPDVFFYGEKIEKIGPDRYRITRGGFTTCVQPTPRWELVSSSATIRLEHYAVLKNSVLAVKGFPVFYMPFIYYPIKKDDRATGFLIPQYGTSRITGSTLSNAFFWAINRSQDATFMHDWYSRTGQQVAGEYRYVRAAGAEGNFRANFLNQHEATYLVNGLARTQPASRSYTLRGSMTEVLSKHLRARASINYFSSLTIQQTYNHDILQASQSQRGLNGSVSGNWGLYSVNAGVDRTEYLYASSDTSVLYGAMPRVTANRAERPIGNTPIYFSVQGEYADLLRENRAGDKVTDSGLNRIDFSPVMRVPFRKWPFFTINSSVAWRFTRWSESLFDGQRVEEPVSRRYIDLQSNITGPVFTKVWNTPENGYAEKFKHTVEPYFNLRRTTAVDNFDQIVQLDSVDTIIGGVTQFTYGLNNRVYAKRRLGSPGGRSREILNVSMRQTYYTDARASTFDPGYQSTFYGTSKPQNFSPISIAVRGKPGESIDATFTTEYDTHFMALRSLAASGGASLGEWLRTSVQWSQRRFILGLPGFNDPNRHDQFLNQSTTVKSPSNKVGAVYSFNYDLGQGLFLQQRILGYYNAQCCGFSVEYQAFDFSGLGDRSPIPKDTRFNFSFTLAGIGSFSNFFGALGGGSR